MNGEKPVVIRNGARIPRLASFGDPAQTAGAVGALYRPSRPSAATLAGPEQAPVEIARYVVGEAVWAPSVHNTQPWWFSAGSGGLSLYADLAQPLLVARLNWEPGPAATG